MSVTDGADRVLLSRARNYTPYRPIASKPKPKPVTYEGEAGDFNAFKNMFSAMMGGNEGTGPSVLERMVGGEAQPTTTITPTQQDRVLHGSQLDDTFTPSTATDVETIAAETEGDLAAMAEADKMLAGELTAPSREAIQKFRDQVAESLQTNAKELARANQSVNIQDILFKYQADRLGLDPDVGLLMSAIDAEGGVGEQTLAAIEATLADENLTAGQKDDTIDLLMNRFTHGSAAVGEARRRDEAQDLLNEVKTLVQNEKDLDALLAHPLADGLADEIQYLQPMFTNSLVQDPTERYLLNLESTFDKFFPEFDPQGNEYLIDAWEGAMALAAQGALTTQSGPMSILMRLMPDASPQKLIEAFNKSVEYANNSEEALEASLNADKLTPGSEALMYAAQTAAQEVGFGDTQAQLFSNSQALHAIIEQKSNGQSGYVGEGTIRGIGGLTEDTYRLVMSDPESGDDGSWSEDRGMNWELQALSKWVGYNFDGDITKAISYYYRTGDWGGTGAFNQGDE